MRLSRHNLMQLLRRTGVITAWIGLIIFIVISGIYASTGYVGFDEAVNLQMPVNLVQHGKYGTTYQGGKIFDPVITTGPTVLLPIALSFAVFGVGILQARLVIFLFWLIFILLFSLITYRFGGWLSMLLAVIWSAFLPFILDFGLKVMGEIPGMAFLLIGLWALSKNKPFLGAMLLGSSVLTKTNYLFVLGPLALFYGLRWLLIPGPSRKETVKSGLTAVTGFVLPILAWEAVRLVVLGWTGYWRNWNDYLSLLGFLPGTLHILAPSSLKLRLQTIGFPYGVLYKYALGGGVLFLGAVMAWGFYSHRSGISQVNAEQETRFYWLLNASGMFFLALWLFSKGTNVWRHLLPGYLLWGLLVCVTLVRGLQGAAKKRTFDSWNGIKRIGLALLLIFLVFYPVKLRFHQLEVELTQSYTCQMNLAQQIRQMSEQKAVFGYWGWYQSPELSFLSQVNFYDVAQPATRDTFTELATQGYQRYVLVSWVQEAMAKETFGIEGQVLGKMIKNMCGEKIYQYAGK
jgi:hypothetical protein